MNCHFSGVHDRLAECKNIFSKKPKSNDVTLSGSSVFDTPDGYGFSLISRNVSRRKIQLPGAAEIGPLIPKTAIE